MVSENTKTALFELIKQCFIENRIIDRLVSVLGVDFAYSNSANLIHHHIAHYFPQLADEIGSRCLERYNISIVYGETPSAEENYATLLQIFETLEQNVIDFQSMLMGVNKIALDNNDLNIFADLQDLLVSYNKVVEQVILLKDKIRIYGTNPSFDNHIDKFWILDK